jgi:ribosomal protein L14
LRSVALRLPAGLSFDPANALAGVRVVLDGHRVRPSARVRDGVITLLLAGRPRVAVITISGVALRVSSRFRRRDGRTLTSDATVVDARRKKTTLHLRGSAH